LRARLREHLLALAAACPETDPGTLAASREQAAHASPGERQLRRCPRCDQERPHKQTAGIFYCPCGGFHIPGGTIT
jgi:ribosomal protein L37AE/L43A